MRIDSLKRWHNKGDTNIFAAYPGKRGTVSASAHADTGYTSAIVCLTATGAKPEAAQPQASASELPSW